MKRVVWNELIVQKNKSYYFGLQLAQFSVQLSGFYFDRNASIKWWFKSQSSNGI